MVMMAAGHDGRACAVVPGPPAVCPACGGSWREEKSAGHQKRDSVDSSLRLIAPLAQVVHRANLCA